MLRFWFCVCDNWSTGTALLFLGCRAHGHPHAEGGIRGPDDRGQHWDWHLQRCRLQVPTNIAKYRPVRSLCKVGVDTVHCCSRLYNECTADWHGSVLSRSHMILPEPDPKIYRDLNSDLVFSGKKNEEKFKEELTNPKILPQNLSNAIIINFT